LCVAFIAFSCIRYACTVLLCADSLGDGLGCGFISQRPSHDDKYGEAAEVTRKLECSHVFHSACIDKWLRIKATCPLCQSL
ncbi:hypothetical protein CARUB_v10012406mg, partial [Capsella rubella]